MNIERFRARYSQIGVNVQAFLFGNQDNNSNYKKTHTFIDSKRSKFYSINSDATDIIY